MSLGAVRSQQFGELKYLAGGVEATHLQIQQAHIQEQVPIAEAQTHRFLVIFQFALMIADHPIRKTQVVVRERVFGIMLDDEKMPPNSLRVALGTEIEISCRIADLTVEPPVSVSRKCA